MDDFPAKNEVDDYGEAFPAEETEKDDNEDGDFCRICRSPEGPDNPLRYPCACRGSIKYVHQECLLLWLNRSRNKQCEVCRRSYSFVRVYAENAPERLPWNEFMRGLLLRALRLVVWVFVMIFNAYCFPLHPWGRESAIENQRVFRVSEKFAFLLAGFMYNGIIAYVMTMLVFIRLVFELVCRRLLLENIVVDDIGHGGGNGLVLWKHMGILCDWWYLHLLRYRLFQALMMDFHGEVVVRPRHAQAQLHEFGAIRRFLFFLDDNAFAVLAISTYVSFFFVLLPFVLGKLVFGLLLLFPRMEVALQLLSRDLFGKEPVIVGYMIMVVLAFAYFGSFVLLFQVIAEEILLGFLVIAVAIPYLLWTSSVKVWKNLSMVKDGFVLCLKIGVLPLVLGCWLDFCSFPILGTTIFDRLELLSEFPFLIIMHWMVGNHCLLFAFNSTVLIHKIIPKRIWFLLDISDPNYKITNLYLGQILFALAFHLSLMVLVVHLPIMSISYLSPSFFPIQLWIYEERNMFRAMAAYVCLVQVGVLEWSAKLIKSATEPLVHKWIVTVSSWLELSEFLLENCEDQNMRPLLEPGFQIHGEWSLVYSMAEGSIVTFYGSRSDNDTTFQVDLDHDRFIPRIGLMLVLAASSLFLMSTMAMALPIQTGRAFFHSISFIMLHFGLKTRRSLWFLDRMLYPASNLYQDLLHIQSYHDWKNRFASQPYPVEDTEYLTVLHLALLGLLIDLMIIIPSQVPLNESPVHSLIQDWLIGLVVLHIWTYMTMFTRINCFATVAFWEKLERIRTVGINRLPCTWLLRDVIGSTIVTLLTTLGFPFLVAYSLFPLLGFPGAVNFTVQRLIWPVLLAFIIIGFVAKLTLDLFVYIHRLDYDDRYLVGDRVTDFTEDLNHGINSAGL